MRGSTTALVNAGPKSAPVKYITQAAAIKKWPIVYMTVLSIVAELLLEKNLVFINFIISQNSYIGNGLVVKKYL